jgi:hypothetical protein
MTTRKSTPDRFRIWITRFSSWQPRSWRDLPPEAVAIELAEVGCFSATEAVAYIEGHNTAAIGRRDRRWAVAVPVVLAYEGDPQPGDVIFPQQMALTPCAG